MKKLLITLSLILISYITFGQGMSITQSIVETGPFEVGDEITIRYTINSGTQSPRYLWLRYQYNNKVLLPIANSTVYSQGNSVQTFTTEWNNFKFFPKGNIPSTQLFQQYQSTPWDYRADANSNVGQLTIQRTDAKIDGVFATQRFVIRDNVSYENFHQLSLAYSTDVNSQAITPITTTGTPLSLGTVLGGSSSFRVKVAFPTGYSGIVYHTAQLRPLNGDGTINFSQQPIAQLPLDGTGEALFTTQVKIGDEFGIWISPATQQPFMNDIVTVSDAYKAFLGHAKTDIGGTPNFFTYPNLERNVGNVSIGDNTFNENDSYLLFAYVMGINVSTISQIPTSTATSVKWQSGLLAQSWLNGTPQNRVQVNSNNQLVNMVYAWGGDLDWSHSTDPAVVAQIIGSNASNRTSTPTPLGSYQQREYEQVGLSVSSKLEGGKVVLTTELGRDGLAGLELIMNYDATKLELDNIIFDSGNTVTNFSTKANGRITFGSIDQLRTGRIKKGTPYRLIFTPKTQLTSTTGLFFFTLTDAVDGNGNKINLVIQ